MYLKGIITCSESGIGVAREFRVEAKYEIIQAFFNMIPLFQNAQPCPGTPPRTPIYFRTPNHPGTNP
jgi:hypothetical protein